MTDLDTLVAERNDTTWWRTLPEPDDPRLDLVEAVTGHRPVAIKTPARRKNRLTRDQWLRKQAEHRAYILTELDHIWGTDLPENIARRLGYANLDSMQRSLNRWEEHQWAARIDQRNRI